MQDRYLFRGKQLYNGEWGIGLLSQMSSEISTLRVKNGETTEPITVITSTVGQCIGLRAVKSYRGESEQDRLIFEGDIITSPFGKAKTVWSEDFKRWLFIGMESQRVLRPSVDFNGYEIEIIGNIYDKTGV